jgi:uncharacterized surface protein with fasciclin (FAS1) repeats
VAGVQQLLADLGFYTGPIDGTYSAATVEAVRALQRELGVPETGLIDAATLRAAYERGLATGTPTTEAPTTEPPTTEAPTTEAPTTEAPTTAPATTLAPTTTVPADTGTATMLDVLRSDDRFTTLVELIDGAGFTADLSPFGRISVLAPTNDAFAALDAATLEELRGDSALLAVVLSYHMLDAEWTLADLATVPSVATVHGASIAVAVDGDLVRFDGSAAIPPEMPAGNGSVIPIDGVLMPPDGT